MKHQTANGISSNTLSSCFQTAVLRPSKRPAGSSPPCLCSCARVCSWAWSHRHRNPPMPHWMLDDALPDAIVMSRRRDRIDAVPSSDPIGCCGRPRAAVRGRSCHHWILPDAQEATRRREGEVVPSSDLTGCLGGCAPPRGSLRTRGGALQICHQG